MLAKHSCAEIEAMCEEAGLPFARVQTPSDLFDDPHLNAGGMIDQVLPDGRATRIPGLPMQFGEERLGLRLPLPKPGEHNDEVLGPLGV
jgi:crotonobetainyl-CoA:carnitine CoA-transferase CaiB-like acyl-CoA transferase